MRYNFAFLPKTAIASCALLLFLTASASQASQDPASHASQAAQQPTQSASRASQEGAPQVEALVSEARAGTDSFALVTMTPRVGVAPARRVHR